ncbi:hypothetical protein VTK26DRAFT_3354 [Humicola hyalothermophila]
MEESSSESVFPSSDESAPAPAPPSPPSHARAKRARRRREANVYDAVAGRVTLNGALGDAESVNGRSKRRLSSTADRYSSRNVRLAPEEVLFKRRSAPTRYAEHDIYWANEDLPNAGRGHLPDGGLLKSVHGYASRFYEAVTARLGAHSLVGNRTIDERSMDETALLAFGILLEEASRDVLGKRGDLVFTEASAEETRTINAIQAEDFSNSFSGSILGAENAVASPSHRGAKRRKVAKGEAPEKEGHFDKCGLMNTRLS